MSTNRPFFANFLAAFRAQSVYKAKPPSPGTTNSLTAPHLGSSSASTSTRGITAKAAASPWATSSSSAQQPPAATAVQASSSSASSSTNLPSSSSHSHPTSPRSHTRPSVNSGSQSPVPGQNSSPISVPGSHNRHRRGSDSSSGSGGFRDALGADRWYIGGQTAAGEERFYPLGMVTKAGGRLKSGGRVGSLDQLSL